MPLALIAAAAVAAASPPSVAPVDCARFTKVAEGVSAECGFLRVPELREDPRSRTIGVPFVVVRNPERSASDAVAMLTGGPGNRGIPRTVRPVDPAFGPRDVIFFEQRGTALADPRLDCAGYGEEKQRAQRGEIDGPELARGLVAVAARCVAEARAGGASLAGYTTREIVADLEDLRHALGFERLDLVGLSYSGKVVSEYARDFPQRTRAVVANSPLTVEANYDEFGQSAMRRTLGLVFAGCAQQAACDDAYPELERKFREIVARAAAEPWRLELPDPDAEGATRTVRATPWVVANALLDQLYEPTTFETLPARIDAIWHGDRQALGAIVDISKSGYPWLMRLSVWCSEEVPFEDAAAVTRDLAAYPEFAGVDQATVPAGLCAAAGFDARPPAAENAPVASEVPFLIFSGQFDPATPPVLHRQMARSLPNSTLVVFPAQGHGAGFTRCGADLIRAFLADPAAELDTGCANEPAAPDFGRTLPGSGQ